MDCVGCQRCKTYAKLQSKGLGAALKVLFNPTEKSTLSKSEIVVYHPIANPPLLGSHQHPHQMVHQHHSHRSHVPILATRQEQILHGRRSPLLCSLNFLSLPPHG